LFVFVVSAALAGLAGMLYVPQVGIITPAQIGVLPSLEMVIWVAVGGRATLVGAIIGAVGVNLGRSILTNYFPELWPFMLGGLFVAVVLLFPDGVIGLSKHLTGKFTEWSTRTRKSKVTEERPA
jgi:urea transport system permease protein